MGIIRKARKGLQMSENQDDIGTYTLTVPVPTSFPNLLEAKAVMRNGKATGDPKYSDNFEFEPEHPDLPKLKATAVAVARAKWPGVDISTLKMPFSDGSKLADKAKAKGKDREWSRGKIVLTARSKYPAQLVAIVNSAMKEFEGASFPLAKPYFYNGVECLARVNFVAYDAVDDDGKPGVTCYLQMVCSLNKGTKHSGGQSAAEVFKGYVGIVSNEDPTSGADDIAF